MEVTSKFWLQQKEAGSLARRGYIVYALVFALTVLHGISKSAGEAEIALARCCELHTC